MPKDAISGSAWTCRRGSKRIALDRQLSAQRATLFVNGVEVGLTRVRSGQARFHTVRVLTGLRQGRADRADPALPRYRPRLCPESRAGPARLHVETELRHRSGSMARI